MIVLNLCGDQLKSMDLDFTGKSWGRTPGGAQHSSDLAVNAAVLGFICNPHTNLSYPASAS